MGMSAKIYWSNLSRALLEGQKLKTLGARGGPASSRHVRQILLGAACIVALGLSTALSASPAAAKYPFRHKLAHRPDQHARKLPFGEIPKGPLEIFVSIDQQRLHFYSGGVHIADEPVATGVPGHLTPLGIFDVIQRDRYHHSNIYDNAPMPFMERITWSGVALHEGVGLGHQASHGCIRMPHDFAARLWMLPTMGMRVIIARPELRPIDFADPHLFVHKDQPSNPTASLPPAAELAQTVDPGTKTDAPPADGLRLMPLPAGPATGPAGGSAAPAAAAPAEPSTLGAVRAPAPAAANPGAPASNAATGTKTAQLAAAATLTQVVKGAEAAAQEPSQDPAAAAKTPAAPSSAASAPTPTPAASSASGMAQTSSPSAPAAPTTNPPAEAANVPASPADITAPISLEDVPLPPIRPLQIGKGSGPIAIFISRKTKKIYVRQNFEPLFDAPITIEHPEQPLGTYLFTAMDYLPDHSTFRWTVVTLPATATKEVAHWKYVWDSYGRRRRIRVEERVSEPAPPPDTPQEAIARIEIPQDAINQISRLIVPGSSLIISDQGLGPETGSGTDFIVVSR
jgi:L,D-transpeptidase catalytic domain